MCQYFGGFRYHRSLYYWKREHHYAYPPSNSPNLDVLDLFSITSIQAVQSRTDASPIDQPIDASNEAFDAWKVCYFLYCLVRAYNLYRIGFGTKRGEDKTVLISTRRLVVQIFINVHSSYSAERKGWEQPPIIWNMLKHQYFASYIYILLVISFQEFSNVSFVHILHFQRSLTRNG